MDGIEINTVTIILRLLLAAFLGGLVGWEREQRNKQAGFKTHLIVSVGSALIMLISIYGFSDFINHPNARFDPARLAAQVISGIGFLGAGAILRHSNKVISGLTTAATLWVVAAIGLGVGAGFYIPAIATTAIVLISTILLGELERKILKPRRYKTIQVLVNDAPGKLGEISLILGEEHLDIRNVSITEETLDDSEPFVTIDFTVKTSKQESILRVVDRLKDIKGVREIHYD